MTHLNRTIQVPNLPTAPSHAPAGWADLIDEAIALLDREYPSGWKVAQIKQKFGGLCFYCEPYKEADPDHREQVQQAITDIEDRSYHHCDTCGAPAQMVTERYVRRTRCDNHRRSTDVDLAIVERPVLALNQQMGGVWLVETQGSSHLWDLDSMNYTRQPGPTSHAGSMRFDGNAMPITRVDAWPTVGDSFLVWFDDPDDADQVEHYHLSSTIDNIRRAEHRGADKGP